MDRDSGIKRGFGFVEMINKSGEKNAIYDLKDVKWTWREIRGYEANQRDRSSWRNRGYDNKK